jgi:uncharacterized membrane protein YtjA (UPF0391 family)
MIWHAECFAFITVLLSGCGDDDTDSGVSLKTKEIPIMLYWALVFFIVAILAGAFGFFGLAAGAAEIAKILFFVFLVLFVVSLLTGMRPRGTV